MAIMSLLSSGCATRTGNAVPGSLASPPHRFGIEPTGRSLDMSNQPVATATATDARGIVVSPHAPHKKIDVRNYPPGSIAVDPHNGKRFRVP